MEKRAGVYAVVAACIAGIAVVAFCVFKYLPASESFSELYFENQEQLPDRIRVGEEESFVFTVVSHEGDKSSYHYTVRFDDQTIKEGTFNLLPQEEKTINIAFTAGHSSLAFADRKTESYTTHFQVDNIAAVMWPGGKSVRTEENHVILPNQLFI